MRNLTVAILASTAGLFPMIAVAQHTGPGAPMTQGQQHHPSTTIAPQGSAPEIGELNDTGDMIRFSTSELEGVAVVNEFGQNVGTVSQVVEGDGGLRYVVVMIQGQRPTIFPIMLMGVHGAGLVVQGYGQDLLRAQTLAPEALAEFNPVHASAAIEMPQVALRQQ